MECDTQNKREVCSCKCNGDGNGNGAYGNLILQHNGAYIARFYISWDQIILIDNKSYTVTRQWENNGRYYTSGFYTTIPIPMNATNIHIKVEGNTGLVWQLWNTIIDKYNLEMVPIRTVKIWGTSLDQQGFVDPDRQVDYGYLYIDHYGGYVARFFIYWYEPEVVNNNVYTVVKEWENNGVSFTSPYHAIIPLPMNTSEIYIRADGLIDLADRRWTRIINKVIYSMLPKRTVTLSGSVINPSGTVEPS